MIDTTVLTFSLIHSSKEVDMNCNLNACILLVRSKAF